jgi:hypothetical protein
LELWLICVAFAAQTDDPKRDFAFLFFLIWASLGDLGGKIH